MRYLFGLLALLVPALAPAQTLLRPSRVPAPLSSHEHIYLTQKLLFLSTHKDTLSGCASSFVTVEPGQFIVAAADDNSDWVRIANVLITPQGKKAIIQGADPTAYFFTMKSGLDLVPYEVATTPAKRSSK